MATKQVTDWLRRIHYRADPSARVIDCFRVEVMDMHLLSCSFNRPNVTLKQLWEEALDTARFLQNSFQQRVQCDWRQFGLKGPNDLRPFAMIWGSEEEREKVKYQVNFDMMIGECGAHHMERVVALGNVLDGDEWLELN
jgi:hypothetical protein